MSKQESVADIIARRKKVSSEQTKKEVKKKPAKKKAGVVVGKKKVDYPKTPQKKTYKKKPKNDVENLLKPEVYLEFVRFIATLPNFRKLQTQEEFAKEYGVNVWTLTQWKKRDGFWDSVREERKVMMKNDMIPNIIMAVYRKALRDGSSKEAKLLLELGGEYEEKRVIDNRISNLSPERAKEIDERVRMWDKTDDDDEDEMTDEIDKEMDYSH